MKKLCLLLILLLTSCSTSVSDTITKPVASMACKLEHVLATIHAFVGSQFGVEEYVKLSNSEKRMLVDYINKMPPPSSHDPKEVRVYTVEGKGVVVLFVTDGCVIELVTMGMQQYREVLGRQA